MSTHDDSTQTSSGPTFRVSRRRFLQAAGAGTALAATAAIPMGAVQAAAQMTWDQTADIVVVGSGAAALAAAATAHSLGNQVIVLEKASTIGGTTAKSGGVHWIPNNSFMAKEGITDSKPDALRYMVRLAYPDRYNPADPMLGIPAHEYSLVEAFYDNGASAVDTLVKIGAIKVLPYLAADGRPFPDYFAELPENKAPRGRGISPESVSTPGTAGFGADLIEHLQTYLTGQKIPLLTQHRVVAAVRNAQGAVIGVQATTPGNKTVAVRANKGVVFGSGGYTHNVDRRLSFLRGPVFGGCAVPTNEGDLITIAQALGADLGNMRNAYLAELVVEQALAFSSVPSDAFIIPGDSMLMVNKTGQRVLDEKKVYNERTQVHWTWDPVKAEWPNYLLFMIYDQRVATKGGGYYPLPAAGVTAPYVITGQTWAELATNLEARLAKLAGQIANTRLTPDFAAALAATVLRFNDFANTGKDEDFHRGETPVEIGFDLGAYNGNKGKGNGKPNLTMYPLADTGPYYAIIIGPGTLDTKGGPKVNTKAQVLDTTGKPIPGLYAAGNCAQACSGQAYWAAGGTIGPALTTGYVAGMNAAEEAPKPA